MLKLQHQNYLVVGRFGKVHGVKGWINVHSFTNPSSNIFNYTPWYIHSPSNQLQPLTLTQSRAHYTKKLVKLNNITNPEQASLLVNQDIFITKQQLPDLAKGQYYWHQLEGLCVYLQPSDRLGDKPDKQPVLIGRIAELMAVVSHDVMIVIPCEGSVDQKKRLIPYIPNQTVLDIDMKSRRMLVEWFLDY